MACIPFIRSYTLSMHKMFCEIICTALVYGMISISGRCLTLEVLLVELGGGLMQEVNEAFDELEDGNEDALKGEFDKQILQLTDLIVLINGELTNLDRKKLITLCTIDVHARDVVQR